MLFSLISIGACATPQPIRTESNVDLERFMGDWYVIANIPTFVEKGAHNAVESYRLDDDGSIETTFSFSADGFDGEKKVYSPRGFVRDEESNAIWEMQFIWPFKAEYRIMYLSPEYSLTIVGRSARDYVWVMARQPSISEAEYQAMLSLLDEEGYDVSMIEKVPQNWGDSNDI